MAAYEEKQVFRLRWIFIPITLLTLIPILAVGSPDGIKTALAITFGVLLFSGLLLYSMKQTIRINKNGVQYKQGPFHRTFRSIPWQEIKEWKISRINALGDFGGWGIRMTGKKNGYIIEGDYGLELKTEAKKSTVLSIINEEEAAKAMEKYGQYV